MLAVVLTGPPGAGKTTVLGALSDALSDADIAHATVEVEALVWTHPPLSDEEYVHVITQHCQFLRDAGHTLLVVAQTLETDEDVAELLGALGADAAVLVRLEARATTLVERLREREPASWSGLEGLVEHAQVLAETMPGLSNIDLALSTDGQRPEDVAARIRAGVPALEQPRRR
jgi:ATPase subunit of ABC transporter with duplicated ATPase domains